MRTQNDFEGEKKKHQERWVSVNASCRTHPSLFLLVDVVHIVPSENNIPCDLGKLGVWIFHALTLYTTGRAFFEKHVHAQSAIPKCVLGPGDKADLNG